MKPGKDLEKALAAAKTAMERRLTIERAIEGAVALQPGAEARLQTAMEALGEAEADAALSGQASRGDGHYAALNDARAAADGLSARIAALRRKLVEQETEILDARAALVPLRDEFVQKCLEEFRVRFLKEIEPVLEVIRAGLGLAEGLGANMWGLSENRLVDPLSANQIPIFADGQASNRTANNARDAVVSVRENADAIGRAADAIERARTERENKPALRPADVQRGLLPPYSGLTAAEWREAQLYGPRPMNHITVRG